MLNRPLSTLNEIETLEITNPDNRNGFSINMKETNV